MADTTLPRNRGNGGSTDDMKEEPEALGQTSASTITNATSTVAPPVSLVVSPRDSGESLNISSSRVIPGSTPGRPATGSDYNLGIFETPSTVQERDDQKTAITITTTAPKAGPQGKQGGDSSGTSLSSAQRHDEMRLYSLSLVLGTPQFCISATTLSLILFIRSETDEELPSILRFIYIASVWGTASLPTATLISFVPRFPETTANARIFIATLIQLVASGLSFVSTVFVVTTGIELEEVCGDISDSYSDQNRCGSLDDIVRAWGGVAIVTLFLASILANARRKREKKLEKERQEAEAPRESA